MELDRAVAQDGLGIGDGLVLSHAMHIGAYSRFGQLPTVRQTDQVDTSDSVQAKNVSPSVSQRKPLSASVTRCAI
jgi:hypothetical protein